MKTRRTRLRVAALAVGMILVAAACNEGMTVNEQGVYTGSNTTTISGTLTPPENGHSHIVSVKVNDTDATIDGNSYSAQVPLDGAAILNRVLVKSTWSDGTTLTERRTVVYGDGTHGTVVPKATMLQDSSGLRINDSALNALSSVVKDGTTIDPATMAPAGTLIYQKGGWPDARAWINQAPTISDWNIAMDPQPGKVHATVTLTNLNLRLWIETNTLFGIWAECGYMKVHSDSITITADYGLQPAAGDPTHLDVNMLGAPQIGSVNLTTQWDGGICDFFQGIVGLFLPNMQDAISGGLQGMLGDPDGAGPADSPIADSIEDALANINVSGPIGESLGVNLTSHIDSVVVDNTGVNLRANSAFVADSVAPGAPNLGGLLSYGDSLPPLPGTTPGGQPYAVAVGVSASGFNQLIASQTEKGLLNSTITSFGGSPLTMRSLIESAIPGGGGLVPDNANFPLKIELAPEVAPLVTLDAAPNGRPASLRIGGYRAKIKRSDNDGLLMDLTLDFTSPIGLQVVDGLMRFVVDQPAASDLSVDVTASFINLAPDAMQGMIQGLAGPMFASVSESLQGFPLPQFAGMALQPVEIARVGTALVLFGNLG